MRLCLYRCTNLACGMAAKPCWQARIALDADVQEVAQQSSTRVLRQHRLVQIPADVCKTSSLTHLDISMNERVGAMPDAISSLVHLQLLDCSGCALTVLPETLSSLTALESLAVSHNR